MAVGYEPDGSVAPLYDLGWEGPAGQMYSTINDLNKVLLINANSMCILVHCSVMCAMCKNMTRGKKIFCKN